MDITKRGQLLFVGLASALIACGCTTLAPSRTEPLTQQEIVEMTRAGLPDEQILMRIRQTRTRYRLTAAEIVNLHQAGVSFTVLDYMLQSYVDAVRADQRYADERFWWLYHGHYYWYPRGGFLMPIR